MPRNPSKARCAVPGCHAWAMRDHTRCRAHLRSVAQHPERAAEIPLALAARTSVSLPKGDHELGARRAGAPRGNLNALSHAGYSDGLPEPDLDRLAAAVIGSGDEPRGCESLEGQFGLAIRAIQRRTSDPFRTLLALDRVLAGLIDRVATQLFHQEVSEALAPIPPQERESIQGNLERLAARHGPRKALIAFRRIRRAHEKKRGNGNNQWNRGYSNKRHPFFRLMIQDILFLLGTVGEFHKSR